MTVRENVEFGLLAKGVPPEERRRIAQHFIDLVGLSGFENALPKELSGGMLKRVDLARAYAINPAVLLMDEPFGPLDAQTRTLMQEELNRITHEEKKTVLFVTHDLEEAVYLADKIVVFSARPGRIKEIIEVNVEHPRPRSFRFSEEFIALKQKVGRSIGLI